MATNTELQWYQKQLIAQGAGEYVSAPDGPHTFRDPEPKGISLNAGGEEMIRCNIDGFWVRGVKVAQDDKEAESVYNAFKQWLTWATLNDMR